MGQQLDQFVSPALEVFDFVSLRIPDLPSLFINIIKNKWLCGWHAICFVWCVPSRAVMGESGNPGINIQKQDGINSFRPEHQGK
tara:strand:- start:1752 stop:2003 length:252 start_codon:yes stop_codon:yes gene_type:complete